MTISTKVAAVLAEMRELKVPNWLAGRILGDLADRIESALTKAEAVPVAWRLRIGDSDLWAYCSREMDADFYGGASGLKYFKEPLYAHAPPAVPVESRYECRECDNCGHAGINDANLTQGACFSCEWSGPEPVEDKCPGCGDEGCMTAACPKCGARYRFIAELEPAMLPAESPASVPDGCPQGEVSCDDCGGREFGVYNKSAGVLFCHGCGQFTTLKPTNQEGAAP